VSTFKDIGGTTKKILRYVVDGDINWSAFNASIGTDGRGNYTLGVRSSNYVILEHGELHVATGGPIRNQVWFTELDNNLEIKDLRKLDFSAAGIEVVRGVEDPKVLWRDGWMFTGVFLERNTPVARNCVCYMDKTATRVVKIDVLPGFEVKRPEKNWMTANNKPENFDYVYDGNAVVIGDKVVHWLRDNPKLSALRGNGHLIELGDGTYFGLMHILKISKNQAFSNRTFGVVEHVVKMYDHFFARFDTHGRIIELSEPFMFLAKSIEFAAGIVEVGSEFVISFGRNDASSHLAFIDKKKAMKMLKSVD
jgi:hypothetical protein